jgi:hypothetical protein
MISFKSRLYTYKDKGISQSRDSAVGIATGYGLDDGGIGVQVPVESKIFSSARRPGRLCVHPAS